MSAADTRRELLNILFSQCAALWPHDFLHESHKRRLAKKWMLGKNSLNIRIQRIWTSTWTSCIVRWNESLSSREECRVICQWSEWSAFFFWTSIDTFGLAAPAVRNNISPQVTYEYTIYYIICDKYINMTHDIWRWHEPSGLPACCLVCPAALT